MVTTFPNLSEKKKDKDWHKQFVQAIVKDSVTSTYDLYNASVTTLYDYYNGLQSGEEYEFLQTSENGDTLPAKWINYNKIRTKVNLILGELDRKGFEITAKTVNSGSKVRKQEAKREMLTQVRINKDLADVEAEFPLPISDPNLPEDEQEVEDYFDYEYNDIYEVIMSAAAKYCAEIYNLRHLRINLMRDVVVAGRAVLKSEIVGDVPILRRIDPRNFIFDTSAEDPFLRDSTYFGELAYVPIAEVAEQYGLDAKELKQAYENANDQSGIAHRRNGLTTTGSNSGESFRREGNEIKCMVMTAVWQDTEPFNFKESKDKYGNEHIKFLGDSEEKEREGVKIKKNFVKIWRKGTLIANDFLVDWGKVENMPRAIDNISDTPPPYFAVIPNWINQRGVSMVEQLKGLQDLKNIALYNLQLAIVRSGAKGFIYDVSQLPEDWLAEDMLKYLKTTGLAFIDSKKDGQISQFNQFPVIDLSLSPSVQYYLEISRLIDNEIDTISGINEAREGAIQYSAQTVGVTQASLMQSNLKTEVLYSFFDGLMNNALNHQAGLIKIAWENKEVFAPIIGDVGVDFLKQEVDVDLQDYSMFMEYIPFALTNKDNVQNIIIAAMQAQQISYLDAMKILKEKDINMAIKRYEKAVMKKEKQMAQQQAEMMQQQQAQQEQMMAAQQQAQEGERQHDFGMKQFDRETDLAKARIDLLKQVGK